MLMRRVLIRATFCLVLAWIHPAAALDPVDTDCTVVSYGTFADTGDSWSIEAQPADDDPTTLAGAGSVYHELADGRRFVADAELVRCRDNGGILFDIVGSGRFLATPGMGNANGLCQGRRNPHQDETDCEMHEFRITLRDDLDADFYTFRILDDAGLDAYAAGGVVDDGVVTITPLP
jgi:hypothetical protein